MPRDKLADAAREIARAAAAPPAPAPRTAHPCLAGRARAFVVIPGAQAGGAARATPRTTRHPTPSSTCSSATAPRAAAAFEAEARSIARLFLSEQSRNLVRVFFLQNRMKALGGKSERKFAHVHVVGAGVMGGDIAAWCASRGLTVTLQDRELKYVEPALARAREFFGKRARDPAKSAEMAARLTADVEGSGRAERRHRHRGDLRECRRQARAVREARAAHEAGRDPRDQHLQHRARRPGARTSPIPDGSSACISSTRSPR